MEKRMQLDGEVSLEMVQAWIDELEQIRKTKKILSLKRRLKVKAAKKHLHCEVYRASLNKHSCSRKSQIFTDTFLLLTSV